MAWINVFPEKMNHLEAYGYHIWLWTNNNLAEEGCHSKVVYFSVTLCACVCVMDWAHESQSQRCVCAFVHGCICVCVSVCVCLHGCTFVCVRERVRTSFGHLSHFERKKSCFGVFSTNRGFHRKIPHMLKVFPQARLECQRSAFIELITWYIFSLFYGVKMKVKSFAGLLTFLPPPPPDNAFLSL